MPLPWCLSVVRNSVLRRVRLPPEWPEVSRPVGASVAGWGLRWMAEGTFLDKAEVTDRVISVIKNHEKVDQSKVGPWMQRVLPCLTGAGTGCCFRCTLGSKWLMAIRLLANGKCA